MQRIMHVPPSTRRISYLNILLLGNSGRFSFYGVFLSWDVDGGIGGWL